MIHMFRCYIGRGSMSITDLESRINEWVESNGEWTEDHVSHTLGENNTRMDGTGETFYSIDVRFLPDYSKNNLQTKFEDKLDNKVAWYRVGYHECTHRDGDGSDGGCSWDAQVEWTDKDVSIPDEIPEMVA